MQWHTISSMTIILFVSFLQNFSMNNEPLMCSDLITDMSSFRDIECLQYLRNPERNHLFILPCTITPTLLKEYKLIDPLEEDLLTIGQEDAVFPNAQLWIVDQPDVASSQYVLGGRLTEGLRRTNNVCYRYVFPDSRNIFWIYDGVNKQDKALYGYFYQENDIVQYYLYMVTQASKMGEMIKNENHQPLLYGSGEMPFVMLEEDRNRFVYSLDKGKGLQYSLHIKDLIENSEYPLDGAYKEVASKIIDQLFLKMVSLGNDTYLGITDAGELYSVWLDDNNKICLAKQTFVHSKIFIDISVDSTVVMANGSKQRVALLTKKGELYITDLGEFAQLTLLYGLTIPDCKDVCSLYYKAGNVMVVYSDKICIWKDNFSLLYLCAALKKQYQDTV